MVVAILPNGEIQFIYSDALAPVIAALGGGVTARASHVEPTPNGQWQADMSPVNGPCLPPTATRAASLAQEVEWLEKRLGTI